jgi:glutamate dehydrogenase
VVSLYKQPRAKVFARRDVYARHLNVLVYLPRERYSASVASALAKALQASSGAACQLANAGGRRPAGPRLPDRPARRYPLDLETDIQQPLLSVLDGWHDQFSVLADAVADVPLRASLRKMCATLPPITWPPPRRPPPSTIWAPSCATDPSRVNVRVEADNGHTTIRLYSVDRVPSLSTILPALHNAGVAIDREQAHSLRVNGERHFVTSLSVDAASAASWPAGNRAGGGRTVRRPVQQRSRRWPPEWPGHRRRPERARSAAGACLHELLAPGRQRFSVRYIAETLRKQPVIVKELVDAFLQRFNPALPKPPAPPRWTSWPTSRAACRPSTTPTAKKCWARWPR